MAHFSHHSQYRIAVLDEEPEQREDFINYFEDTFEVIEITEALDIDELVTIIKHQAIDAIAIDYKLKDHGSTFQYNGDYFFKELNKLLVDFPSFILTSDPDNAKRESPSIMPFFIIGKDRIGQIKPGLKEDIYNIITNYKNNLARKDERLRELMQFQRDRTLTEKEEQEYIEINLYIERATYNDNIPSAAFYSPKMDDRISQLLESTKQLLDELEENKDE